MGIGTIGVPGAPVPSTVTKESRLGTEYVITLCHQTGASHALVQNQKPYSAGSRNAVKVNEFYV